MKLETRSQALRLTSPAFSHGGVIPLRYSGRGEDVSPSLVLENIVPEAKSIAVAMDDITHPLFGSYTHWIIWNIPVQEVIPEGVPRGEQVASLDGAIQGIAYGKHRYKGPKPPLRSCHTYRYTVFILDCMLDLPATAKKRELISCMEGHVLQNAFLEGTFQRRPRESMLSDT